MGIERPELRTRLLIPLLVVIRSDRVAGMKHDEVHAPVRHER